MKNNALVFIQNDTPLTTSRTVAEKFGKNHRDVLKAIRELITQTEGMRKNAHTPMFTETTWTNEQNGQIYPQYLITRDGFSLLAMGFTGKKALEFKLKFIDAFNRMEETLRELYDQPQMDERWIQTRLGTKKSFRPFTDAMALLISHVHRNGDTRPDGYFFGHTINILQNACGIMKGQRDKAPVANLNKLDQVQSMIANLILQLLATRPDIKHFEQFAATIRLQLDQLDRLLGGQPALFLNGGC